MLLMSAAEIQSAPAADMETFIRQNEETDLLRLSTAGSVDDGKSTLIGRLLTDSNSVYEDQVAAIRQAVNRSSHAFDLALLTDGLRAEWEQGITIDVAYRYFSTPKRKFIIADTKGHEQYTRNMATGASTANLAIILVVRNEATTPGKPYKIAATLDGSPVATRRYRNVRSPHDSSLLPGSSFERLPSGNVQRFRPQRQLCAGTRHHRRMWCALLGKRGLFTGMGVYSHCDGDTLNGRNRCLVDVPADHRSPRFHHVRRFRRAGFGGGGLFASHLTFDRLGDRPFVGTPGFVGGSSVGSPLSCPTWSMMELS
jgi:hypothetical protein